MASGVRQNTGSNYLGRVVILPAWRTSHTCVSW